MLFLTRIKLVAHVLACAFTIISIKWIRLILDGEYILKQQDTVDVQIPEWKYKANIARNTTFKGC